MLTITWKTKSRPLFLMSFSRKLDEMLPLLAAGETGFWTFMGARGERALHYRTHFTIEAVGRRRWPSSLMLPSREWTGLGFWWNGWNGVTAFFLPVVASSTSGCMMQYQWSSWFLIVDLFIIRNLILSLIKSRIYTLPTFLFVHNRFL